MRFYEQFGEVYCDSSPIPLKNPALLISPRESMLIKWGDSEKLTDDLIKMQRVQIKGFLDDLCIIEFNYQTAFTAEEIAYIFERAINYSSSFIKELYLHFNDGTIKEWINIEQERIPINNKKIKNRRYI